MAENRRLQGAIFKHDGTSYLVLPDNEWEGDHLFVKSIDATRRTELFPRATIEASIHGQLELRYPESGA
jgi:hypothetical protein